MYENNEENKYSYQSDDIIQDDLSAATSEEPERVYGSYSSDNGYEETNNTSYYDTQTNDSYKSSADDTPKADNPYRSYYTTYQDATEQKKKDREERISWFKKSESGDSNGSGGNGKRGGLGKFFGKVVAAGLVFGLVASATFSGVNTILGSSGSSSDTSATLTTSSGDASGVTQLSSTVTETTSDVSDVAEAVMPAMVQITSIFETSYFGMTEESTGAGSGIIVAQTDETLYIVTNNHVIEDASSVSVTFVDDETVTAEIKGTDSSNDLAVLSIAISDIPESTLDEIAVATLGDSDSLKIGQTAIAIGNALGYGQSVTTGVISALNREVTVDGVTNELIQTSAAINPGNSGGALLNSAGEVIGINSAKYTDTDVEGMGYAIPISTAIPIIEELIEREKVSTEDAAYLGVVGVDVTEDVATAYSMPEGLYISQVVSGSAAETAGIQVGDIITEFDGHSISSQEELSELLEYYASGTTVEIVVQRVSNGSYEEVTLTATLGSKANASSSSNSSDDSSSEEDSNSSSQMPGSNGGNQMMP
ncbi:MAG: trypsin-like peptidase domain-containing protein [Eubacterium sp.]|nr:trypsin-like peptidase domain-containing protein [Eubacterium sp.]